MKKRVYITALHMQHGGIEMAISLLSNALAKRGYIVTILSVYNLGEVAYRLEPNVEVQYLTNVAPNRTEFLQAKRERNVYKLLKEGIYSLKVLYLKNKNMRNAISSIEDGIIISTRNEHSVLLSKYGKEGVCKIAQLHHDHEFKEVYVRDFQKNYKRIDRFVLLTQGLKDEVEEMMRGHNVHTKCVVIPNFLEEVISDVEIDQKEKTVLFVGRLHPVKGLERLLDIWKIISGKYPDWKLKIIGGGELDKVLKVKVKQLDLSRSVDITGAMEHDKVLSEMKKASIYAMTSYSEAFPFVLIEAMSKGLPVVAFDVRVGPRAIVEHNKDGFLVEDDDLAQFAEHVSMLISDKNQWVKLSTNALDKSKIFTEKNVIKKWIALFDDCIGEKGELPNGIQKKDS